MAPTIRYFLILVALLVPISVLAREKISLAVSELAPQGVKENEAAVITEQFRVELSKANHIRLIERSQMQEILKEQGFQQSGCTNDACAVEVGQLLGVRNIVIGSIGTAGSYTLLSIRIIDVATGEILINESVRKKGGIDEMLETGIREVSTRVAGKLLPEDASAHSNGKSALRKAFLIGGGTAALIGGGIAAYMVLGRDDDSDKPVEKNVKIELP